MKGVSLAATLGASRAVGVVGSQGVVLRRAIVKIFHTARALSQQMEPVMEPVRRNWELGPLKGGGRISSV